MSEHTNSIVQGVLRYARHIGPCGDYSVYNGLKHQLESLPLTNKEYERTIIQLCNILRI